ncbi:carboxymuconolactone decarboxylase family protein [Streptomyces sp. NPDC058914]|uniref:carboxymuconolactone decarboxylase family protein n=1 Tax=Streptomyces sp. NPDC058914 TaxID=3346671 RepID=UPI00369C38D0
MSPCRTQYKAIHAGGVDERLLSLVHLRAGQINGCSPCVLASTESAQKAGETKERLHNVVAWRDTPLDRSSEESDRQRRVSGPPSASSRADRRGGPRGRASGWRPVRRARWLRTRGRRRAAGCRCRCLVRPYTARSPSGSKVPKSRSQTMRTPP